MLNATGKPLQILAIITAFLALAGAIQQWYGAVVVERFSKQRRIARKSHPPITILKPLCGVEALTEVALESFFLLDYPAYQLVFGVQNADDPVLAVISSLRARYPGQDVALMVNDTGHGQNRKISNLINMIPLAKYDVLVISDADVHVPPYYLDAVIGALEEPGVGVVTTVYTGLPASPHIASELGAAQINYNFLPGALLARQFGRQDCMGVTMAIRASVLAKIGGLQALANNLADDQVLGRLARAAGYNIAIAQVIPATTVPEADFNALFLHELRWARTIRALVPVAYMGTIVQATLLWAVLTVLLSGLAIWSVLLFAGVFGVRVITARRLAASLKLPQEENIWLFLLRDFFSTIIYIASFAGNRVTWRGTSMNADSGRLVSGRKSK